MYVIIQTRLDMDKDNMDPGCFFNKRVIQTFKNVKWPQWPQWKCPLLSVLCANTTFTQQRAVYRLFLTVGKSAHLNMILLINIIIKKEKYVFIKLILLFPPCTSSLHREWIIMSTLIQCKVDSWRLFSNMIANIYVVRGTFKKCILPHFKLIRWFNKVFSYIWMCHFNWMFFNHLKSHRLLHGEAVKLPLNDTLYWIGVMYQIQFMRYTGNKMGFVVCKLAEVLANYLVSLWLLSFLY